MPVSSVEPSVSSQRKKGLNTQEILVHESAESGWAAGAEGMESFNGDVIDSRQRTHMYIWGWEQGLDFEWQKAPHCLPSCLPQYKKAHLFTL